MFCLKDRFTDCTGSMTSFDFLLPVIYNNYVIVN